MWICYIIYIVDGVLLIMEVCIMITINEQSSIRFELDKIICFDPFHLSNSNHDADVIFITHSHYDHFSIEDICKVQNENTIIVCPSDCLEEASKIFSSENIITVSPGDEITLFQFSISVVPAYNIDKPFHPKTNNWVGYLLHDGEVTYYVMGDTDHLPFMDTLKVDYLFVPIGGKFTMNVSEAVELVNKMKPRVAIPIHYGTIIGEVGFGEDFQKKISDDIECRLLLFSNM